VTSETISEIPENSDVRGKQPEKLRKAPMRRPYKFPSWKVKPKVG
jgi:hypothetical protein